MGILDYNFDEFLAWVGEDTDTLMMLIWILPVIIFVFYGQRIQLMISSNEIKKDIGKLEEYTTSTKKDFLNYVKNNLTSKSDPSKKLDSFFDYFTIMPVDRRRGPGFNRLPPHFKCIHAITLACEGLVDQPRQLMHFRFRVVPDLHVSLLRSYGGNATC